MGAGAGWMAGGEFTAQVSWTWPVHAITLCRRNEATTMALVVHVDSPIVVVLSMGGRP